MASDILHTTIERCTDNQSAARHQAATARMYLAAATGESDAQERTYYLDVAARFQRDAAYFADEARIRLDRVNGHA